MKGKLKKERGKLLTVFLCLEIFVQSIPLLQYLMVSAQRWLVETYNLSRSFYHPLPSISDIVFGIAYIVITIGIFKWKRWGVFSLALIVLIELFVNIFVYENLHSGFFQIYNTIFILFLVHQKWYYFR